VPITAIPGAVRLRNFQLGAEVTFATTAVATRRYPWKFTPTVEPHWTFPDVDGGNIDRPIAPYPTAYDYTGSSDGPLNYNDLPALMTALYKPVTPVTSGATTWTCQPASVTQDNFQTFTAEWGDETTDQLRFRGGLLEQLVLTAPDDQGPVTHTGSWRFAAMDYPQAPTGSLSVDPSPTPWMSTDTTVYLDATAAGIEGTALTNAIHSWVLTIKNTIDVKRFQNGSNTRLVASGYGRGLRTVEFKITGAKSAAILTEIANFLNSNPQQRFLGIKTQSPIMASGATNYSSDLRFAGYWTVHADTTHGAANTAAELTCNNVYNPTLTYAQKWVVVNALASL